MANRRSGPSSGGQKNGASNRNKKAGDNKARKKSARRERRHPIARAIGYTAMVIGGLIIVAIGGGVGYATSLLKGLPTITPSAFVQNESPTIVYDKSGQVIAKFSADGDRAPITSVDQVSPKLAHAFVAGEDKTFYSNIGINPLAMGRAFMQDITHHSIQSGASTITQQMVKLAVFPDQQRTMRRKVQEIALAVQATRTMSKDEILTDYMNWVYMGRMGSQDVYGVKTASSILFGKSPRDLNYAEAAFLAAIPNNPSLFSPYQNPQNTVKRQQLILQHMLTDGWITQSQYQQAVAFPIVKDIHQPVKTTIPYPYLVNDDLRPLIDQDLVNEGLYQNTTQADQALATAGYKVYTTIDLNMQKDVVHVLSTNKLFGKTTKTYTDANGKKSQDLYEAGVTLIDNHTGAVLAIGGGRDYYKDYYDHSDLPRQPGSSIKPLLDYGPALEMHKITTATPIMDGPIQMNVGPNQPLYKPHDDVTWWHGIVSARYALVQSLNVPAVKVLNLITPEAGGQYLQEMGITPSSKTISGRSTLVAADLHDLSSAIGGLHNGVTVQQMTSAYTTFPNQGVWRQSYMISRIADNKNNDLYLAQPKITTVFTPQTAYIMDSMLRDVVQQGTATLIGQHFPKNYYIYGKTGTTDKFNNGWFIGYTQDYTMGIWMGYNHNQPIEVRPTDYYNVKFALWNKIMDPILKKDPPTKPIEQPKGITQTAVCKDSGLLPSTACKAAGATYDELFTVGTVPTAVDDVWVNALYTVVNGKKYLATTNTPPNQVKEGTFIDPSKIALNQPWPLPKNTSTSDEKLYVPTDPDPLGGQVLQSPSSNSISTLSPPSNVQALVHSDGTVSLSWSSVDTATSYSVWRSTSPNGPFKNIAGPLTATSYVDNSIPSGTDTVYYEIYAASDSSISPPSSVVEVQFQSAPGFGLGNLLGGVGNGTGPGTSNSPGQ